MESELKELVEELEDNIEDLQEAIGPLVSTPLSESAIKLPVVDKAKLYVLTTYAIESLLFSYLRLNNVKTKDHPIMRELARVRQYVQKIKDAENSTARLQNGEAAAAGGAAITAEGGMSLDKAAAGRFIKHALAGNEAYDKERAETQAREKARAHIRFVELSKNVWPEPGKPAVDTRSAGARAMEVDEEEDGVEIIEDDDKELYGGDDMEVSGNVEGEAQQQTIKEIGDDDQLEDSSSSARQTPQKLQQQKQTKLDKKARKREKKEKKRSEKRLLAEVADSEPERETIFYDEKAETEENEGETFPPPSKKRKKNKTKSKEREDAEIGDKIEILTTKRLKEKKKKKKQSKGSL